MRVTQEQIDALLTESTWTIQKIGQKTTLALLTLPNGFEIVGTSACIDPSSYNEEIGAEYAKKRVVDKLWELLGFHTQYMLPH